MGPPAKKAQISQEAFDSVVNENVEEFGMEMDEALADAITTFTLQGVDLSGIITDGGGGASLDKHPVIMAIHNLQTAVAAVVGEKLTSTDVTELYQNFRVGETNLTPALEADIVSTLDTLRISCSEEGPSNISIAERNGGVEVLLATCKTLTTCKSPSLEHALAALCVCLTDDSSREKFKLYHGPQIVFESLSMENVSDKILENGAAVVAAASTKDEDVKDMFVHLKVYEVLVAQLKKHQTYPGVVQGVCDALRSLVTADDERIAVSRAFQNGMLIAKTGAMDTLLEVALQQIKSTSVLPSLCIALKNLAVNDEICKSVADKGGLELVMKFITTSREQNHKIMARSACILLIQLSGSDTNKDAVVQQLGGLPEIVDLISHFSQEASVVQEALTAVAVLTLRSPVNASEAVKSGVVDVTAEMMEKHTGSPGLQRQACQLIRNLAVRNLENRPIILEKGLEKLIRQAKANHVICRDAASAALRDLGFDDYNM
ncbi:unnamed protein product [Calypogeia fissa]